MNVGSLDLPAQTMLKQRGTEMQSREEGKQKEDRAGGERNECAGEHAYQSESCTGMCAAQRNGRKTEMWGV